MPKHRIKLKERVGEKYEVSRWTPLLQDIAEVGGLLIALGIYVS